MTSSKLNKKLWRDITDLKLLDTETAVPRFRIKETPFDTNDDGQNQASGGKDDEYLIIGQIYPNADIYKERSYMIEIKLTKAYPHEPPQIRFLTPIYHPNVDKDGTFCNKLIVKADKWTPDIPLVQVVKAVVDHIDHPDTEIDYALRAEVAREYQENREEFNRNALENVQQHGLPRQ